jgi:putative hemolysin
MNIGTEILIIFFLILLNGVFALAEIAVVSSRKARLQQHVNEGKRGAATALALAEHPNLFISTTQIGMTLIGVLAGAFGGATIADALAVQFDYVPVLAPYAHTLALGIVVLVITVFSLLLGELVPKRLALHDPERIAAAVAGPMLLLSRIFSPLVRLMSGITDAILRMMGVQPGENPPVTEEELHVLLDQGTLAGVFEESEQDMVQGVFSLSDRRISSLMTQRPDIVWLDVGDTPEIVRATIADSPYSRFPVCSDELDNVLGVIKTRDLLLAQMSGEPFNLKAHLKPVLYIPETALASRALELFKQAKPELMLVIDEFGGVQGLLTITDILEEIVGDIEMGEPQATQRQDGSWLLDGMLSVEDFKEIFNLRHMPNEEEYETLGGFTMLHLGRIPQAADHFDWNGLIFEVVDMDGKRVDKVLVKTKPVTPPVQTDMSDPSDQI